MMSGGEKSSVKQSTKKNFKVSGSKPSTRKTNSTGRKKSIDRDNPYLAGSKGSNGSKKNSRKSSRKSKTRKSKKSDKTDSMLRPDFDDDSMTGKIVKRVPEMYDPNPGEHDPVPKSEYTSDSGLRGFPSNHGKPLGYQVSPL